MTHPHGEEKGFARVVEFPDGASVYIGSLHVADFKLEIEQTHNPAWTPERAANNLAYQINAAHAARVKGFMEIVDRLLDAGESLKDTAEGYIIQTYDRHGVTRRKVEAWDEARQLLEVYRNGK